MRISVVTPSLNQADFIERTVRSVLDQNYPDLEYIVCDGGSTDGTLAVLKPFSGRMRLISEPDDGQSDAVNKGIRATSGEIIGWLNSDDVYRPGILWTVAGAFSRDPDLDVLYGDADLIDADDRVVGRYYTEAWRPRRLEERNILCQPAVFFRRRLVGQYGVLKTDLHYTMDYEYWLRLAHAGARFTYLPYTFADYRLHATSKTVSQELESSEEVTRMLKGYLKRVPDGWLLTYTQALLRRRPDYPFGNPLAFALLVAGVSWRVSLTMNGSISHQLALSTLRTLAAGAFKSALRRPVTPPTT